MKFSEATVFLSKYQDSILSEEALDALEAFRKPLEGQLSTRHIDMLIRSNRLLLEKVSQLKEEVGRCY